MVLFFNVIIFIFVFVVLVKQTKFSRKHKKKQSTMKLMANLMAIVCLFGLTWVFGALTIIKADQAFQIVFTATNSFQGFFIFVFFCIVNSDVRITLVQKLLHKRDFLKTNTLDSTKKSNTLSEKLQTSFELNGSSKTRSMEAYCSSVVHVDVLESKPTLLGLHHMDEPESDINSLKVTTTQSP